MGYLTTHNGYVTLHQCKREYINPNHNRVLHFLMQYTNFSCTATVTAPPPPISFTMSLNPFNTGVFNYTTLMLPATPLHRSCFAHGPFCAAVLIYGVLHKIFRSKFHRLTSHWAPIIVNSAQAQSIYTFDQIEKAIHG